jgi:hypothetical protein
MSSFASINDLIEEYSFDVIIVIRAEFFKSYLSQSIHKIDFLYRFVVN